MRAHLNPTESREKVERAIRNLFGNIEITLVEKKGDQLLESQLEGLYSLKHLKDTLSRERIRDSVRAMLSRWSKEEDRVTFHLNRQAAYSNHVSIYHANKVPMGPIEVGVHGDTHEIIEYLCGKA